MGNRDRGITGVAGYQPSSRFIERSYLQEMMPLTEQDTQLPLLTPYVHRVHIHGYAPYISHTNTIKLFLI